jgi:hypothetical protein
VNENKHRKTGDEKLLAGAGDERARDSFEKPEQRWSLSETSMRALSMLSSPSPGVGGKLQPVPPEKGMRSPPPHHHREAAIKL